MRPLPFPLGLDSTVDLGVEVKGPHPEAHGLAGFGGHFYNFWDKLGVLDVLLQLFQS